MIERDKKALPFGHLLQNTYCLDRVLGAGGFGITYLARDIRHGQNKAVYAVKEYFPQEWAKRAEDGIRLSPCERALNEVYFHGLEVFVNEARILQGLHDDRTIVDIENFFQLNNTAYLVMEYVQGMTLADYMKKKQKTFPVKQAGNIVCSVAKALYRIHSFGLLHRDISPDNIMLLPDGSVKLIDFGATRQFVMNETTDMSVLIKPGFAPMEQYSRSGSQGPWTDVYALAATYYYMVSGRKPLPAVDRCSGGTLKPLRQMNPDIPPAISKFISRALELDYTKRVRDMKEFIDGIGDTADDSAGIKGVPHLLMKANNQIRKWKFEPGQMVKIGRAKEECDICVTGSEISRVHCGICYDKQRQLFFVTDYSANGTYTNVGLIGKGRYAALRSGAAFYLVNRRNQFYLEVR